ncbi:hypothetical protein [Micromonospora sp. NPDC005710]|uniref:hypothetical protein n=1 Tax=Micromonospora sp. NPDC005710 TaxID=3157051 RepID=UPI0033D70902
MTENQDKTVDRRRLLRRAGTVAAGVAGSTVVGAAVAGPAQAAPGDPVLQGRANNVAAAATTSLTSTAAGPTLQLANPAIVSENGLDLARPSLQLAPSGDYLHQDSATGSIGMDNYGNLQVVAAEYNGEAIVDYVHTSGNANRIVPIMPQRVIDTRSAAGRERIVNRSSTTLDSTGRLREGQTIHLDLTDFVFFGDAVFGNITVTTTAAPGFARVFPYGAGPISVSTINFQANQSLSNAFMTGIGFDADYISVFANKTTHIILDVVAFVIGIGAVNPAYLPLSAGAGARTTESLADRTARRAAKAKQDSPSWK